MDQQAEASEPAPSLQPATQMRRERDLLPRDPQDGLSWNDHQPISRVDLFCDRLIVRLLGDPDDLPGLAEDTKLRSKVQVHRCRSDRCGVVWVDPNVTSRNLPEDLIPREDAQSRLSSRSSVHLQPLWPFFTVLSTPDDSASTAAAPSSGGVTHWGSWGEQLPVSGS